MRARVEHEGKLRMIRALRRLALASSRFRTRNAGSYPQPWAARSSFRGLQPPEITEPLAAAGPKPYGRRLLTDLGYSSDQIAEMRLANVPV